MSHSRLNYADAIPIVAPLCVVLFFGLVFLSSASFPIAAKQYGHAGFFLKHQLAYLLLGVLCFVAVVHIPLRVWHTVGPWMMLGAIMLLILLLIPGVGRTVNGSTRWLSFMGFTLQVTEYVKLATVVFIAGYCERHSDWIRDRWSGFLRPIFVLMLLGALVMKQPDFGSFVILLSVSGVVIFLAGARLRHYLLFAVLTGVGLFILAKAAPYRLERMTSFLNPWQYPLTSGYQLTQALMAFGKGGIWGTGIGLSVQKLFYLPEAHTDFLLAVIAEESGLVGCMLLLIAFSSMIGVIFHLAYRCRKAGKDFEYYLNVGIGSWLLIQMVINFGVNVGLLPTKGVTFPFVSYGGSSLLFCFIAMGMVVRTRLEES